MGRKNRGNEGVRKKLKHFSSADFLRRYIKLEELQADILSYVTHFPDIRVSFQKAWILTQNKNMHYVFPKCLFTM